MDIEPRREYVDYLRDILDATQKALRFVEGVDFEAFVANDEKVFAVIRALEIVGEAAKHVPQLVRRRYPRIPWWEMAGMRDKLTHEYFGVNLRRVWETVQKDLPALEPLIAEILADINAKERQ